MRRSEIDSTREAGMPSRFFPIAWLVVLVLFSLPLVSACGGGSSGREQREQVAGRGDTGS